MSIGKGGCGTKYTFTDEENPWEVEDNYYLDLRMKKSGIDKVLEALRQVNLRLDRIENIRKGVK